MSIVDKTVGELSVDGILCGLYRRQSASCQLTVYYVDCTEDSRRVVS